MKESKITIDLYGCEIILLYGTYDDIYTQFLETYPSVIDELDDPFICKYWIINAGGVVTRYFIVTDKYDIGNIYHDALHVANDILDVIGFKFHYGNDEPQAYLMEHIGTSVLRELKTMNDG